MTREEQQALAADLIGRFAQVYLTRAAHAPEDWGARELRRFLISVAERDFPSRMDRGDVRRFNSDIATTANL